MKNMRMGLGRRLRSGENPKEKNGEERNKEKDVFRFGRLPFLKKGVG